MVNIKQINCNEDAKICDKLLTELIQSEHKFNNNIKKDYVVKDYFEKIDKKIVGFIYCRLDFDNNGPMLYKEALIDGLYVKNEYRKRGIASTLIEYAKIWAKDKGVKKLYINVLEKNKNAMNL